jgi:hypothetical protein
VGLRSIPLLLAARSTLGLGLAAAALRLLRSTLGLARWLGMAASVGLAPLLARPGASINARATPAAARLQAAQRPVAPVPVVDLKRVRSNSLLID